MRPILFEIFGFPIRAYGTFIALAVLIATYVAIRLARRQGYAWAEKLEDLVVSLVLAGVVGARIWDVAFSLEKYRGNWWEILAIWHGGLSVQGAVVGGLIAAMVFARGAGNCKPGEPCARAPAATGMAKDRRQPGLGAACLALAAGPRCDQASTTMTPTMLRCPVPQSKLQ